MPRCDKSIVVLAAAVSALGAACSNSSTPFGQDMTCMVPHTCDHAFVCCDPVCYTQPYACPKGSCTPGYSCAYVGYDFDCECGNDHAWHYFVGAHPPLDLLPEGEAIDMAARSDLQDMTLPTDAPAVDMSVPPDDLSLTDLSMGACQPLNVWRYENPGCGMNAKPVCGAQGGDLCLRFACSCTGKVIEGCDYFPEPWTNIIWLPDMGTCALPDGKF